MPANDERWLDAEAGPVVRPYALTQGRTRHAGESFDLVATVMTTRAAIADLRELGLVMIRTPVVMAERIDKHTLREVLNGLRGL